MWSRRVWVRGGVGQPPATGASLPDLARLISLTTERLLEV